MLLCFVIFVLLIPVISGGKLCISTHKCKMMRELQLFFRWAGVSEARGDYPFSHHKLTVQFYEVAAAQDRKLEGLVHKAILELWRPDPSELTLLLTKGVDSTLIKVPPSAITLTGSSDPCYLEAYHLADASDGRISLHLKVKFCFLPFFLMLLKALYVLGRLQFPVSV